MGCLTQRQLAAQGDVQPNLRSKQPLRVSFVVQCASQELWTEISEWLGLEHEQSEG